MYIQTTEVYGNVVNEASVKNNITFSGGRCSHNKESPDWPFVLTEGLKQKYNEIVILQFLQTALIRIEIKKQRLAVFCPHHRLPKAQLNQPRSFVGLLIHTNTKTLDFNFKTAFVVALLIFVYVTIVLNKFKQNLIPVSIVLIC